MEHRNVHSGLTSQRAMTAITILLRNYLLTALRYLSKHRVFSLINIACLTIGMACSFIILVWVKHELSYDRFHKEAPRLFRVSAHIPFTNEALDVAVTPQALGRVAQQEVSGFEAVVRIKMLPKPALRYREKVFYEKDVLMADPRLFELFSYPFIQGDPTTCLLEPGSIVLSKKLVSKYFGDLDPIGREIEINNRYRCKVTAVIGDPPGPTHLPLEAVIPLSLFFKDEDEVTQWRNYNTLTYCLVRPGKKAADLSVALTEAFHSVFPYKEEGEDEYIRFDLENVRKLHLQGGKSLDSKSAANLKQVWIFLVTGAIILLIAIINFMNHMTARARLRFREIAVRKALGATRNMLIHQFLGESIIISILSWVLAMSMLELLVPIFGRFMMEGIQFTIQENTGLAIVFLVISLVSGVMAGIYPALVLSKLEPYRIFRGDGTLRKGRKALRQSLVVVQFAVSIALIASALMVGKQLRFVQQKELGFDPANILVLGMNESLQPNYTRFREALLEVEGVERVTAASMMPMFGTALTSQIKWEGIPEDLDVKVNFAFVDFDYFRTMGIPVIKGRCFSPVQYDIDSLSFIVNEQFAALLGEREALGVPLTFREFRHGRIIGVVKDHHFSSLHHPIGPLVFMITREELGFVFVRIDPFRPEKTIQSIAGVWDTYSGLFPFEANFLEDRYKVLYDSEIRMYSLLMYFAILALVISFLGLFGLATFMAEQSLKEIGIRKVYGATPGQIAWRHLREIGRWVLISGVLALPVSWFMMDRWLDRFAYVATLSPTVLLLAMSFGLIMAILASSWQVILSARMVPSMALRYE